MNLSEDQIHDPAFQKISDYIWSPNLDDEYVNHVVRDHNPNLKIVNNTTPPSDGILYVGMQQLIEDVYRDMPPTGNYIVIYRPSDRSYTERFHRLKPPSVKHVFTVNAQIIADDVTALPFGVASIGGEDEILKMVAMEQVQPARTKIFVRYNVNNSGYTEERKASIPKLQAMPYAKVITAQIPTDTFMREIKAHPFTMSLQGCGKDGGRTWAAMILGSTPIVTECIEMRHFSDMPLIYCPPDVSSITEEWLAAQDISGSTRRIRMSYWKDKILSL